MISTNERSTTGTNKKISVIMGVYNQNNFRILFDAVNSILNQTYSNFEFLIYNDGSKQEVSEVAPTKSDDNLKSKPVISHNAFTHFSAYPGSAQMPVPIAVAPIFTVRKSAAASFK